MNNRDLGKQVTPPVGQTFTLYEASEPLPEADPATREPRLLNRRKALVVPAIDLTILVGTGIVVTWILWDLSHLLSASSVRLGLPVVGLILSLSLIHI